MKQDETATYEKWNTGADFIHIILCFIFKISFVEFRTNCTEEANVFG